MRYIILCLIIAITSLKIDEKNFVFYSNDLKHLKRFNNQDGIVFGIEMNVIIIVILFFLQILIIFQILKIIMKIYQIIIKLIFIFIFLIFFV